MRINIKENIKMCIGGMIEYISQRKLIHDIEVREKKHIRINNIKYKTFGWKEHEKEWWNYWSPVVRNPGKWGYRLYSHYCGHDKCILSSPITIELNKCLNPSELLPYYGNKNFFDKILPKDSFPKTILRVMDGLVMDASYNTISEFNEEVVKRILSQYDKVILKPTVGTSSGNGVKLFSQRNGMWKDVSGEKELNTLTIRENGQNLILQECIEQHPFMAQFNPTSVNTLRIATYLSPVSGDVNFLSAVIRMGAENAYVDNLHTEGKMVGVDLNCGKLANNCMNAEGTVFDSHNGVHFQDNNLKVPNIDVIKEWIAERARALYPLKLIQWDVAIKKDGTPVLMEYNADGFSMWIAEFNGLLALGPYTDEVRAIAMKKKKSFRISFLRHS